MALLKTNTGIGTTNPTSALHVIGDVLVTGVVTSTTFNGNINTGVATITTATITNLTNTRLTSGIGTITNLNNEFLNVSGVGSIANLHAPNAAINVGVVTNLNNTRFISGIATINNLISTASTITDLTGTNATITRIDSTHVNAGIVTATQLSTGSVGSAINITSNSITGPSSIVIDPAAVGDDTGAVRIKGDLYVDGTEFVVNSGTIELADLRVGIATTVGSNLLLDGGGIGIGSTNILKTFTYNYASDSLKSSENLDISLGKTYKVDGTDVLSSDTLGSGVIYSSLQYLGTLNHLNVSGLSTLPTLVGSYATITEIETERFLSGISSITNLYVSNGYINVGLVTDISGTRLNYTGVGTITTINSDTATINNLTSDYNNTGVGTISILNTGIGTITNLNNEFLNVSGVGSIANLHSPNISINVGIITDLTNTRLTSGIATITNLDVTNSTFTNVNVDNFYAVTGIVTDISGTRLNYTGVGTISTLDTNTADINNIVSDYINVGVATAVILNSGIGTVNNLNSTLFNVSGVGTIATLNSTYTNLTNINATGISTLADIRAQRVTVTGIVTANSFRPTSGYIQAADGTNSFYIYNTTGNVAFQGTIGVNQINNAGGFQVLTFNNLDTRLTGNLDIAGVTTSSVFNGNIYSLGVSTFRNGPVLIGTGTSTGTAFQPLQVTGGAYVSDNLGLGLISPTSKLDVVGDGRFTGVVTATTFNGNINAGVSTLGIATAINLTSQQLIVSGLSTFIGVTTFQNDVYVSGDLYVTNDLKLDEITARNVNVTGVATIFNLVGTAATITTFNNTTSTITDLSNTRLTSGIATITDLNVTNSTFNNLNTTNLNAVTGVVTTLSGTNVTYTNSDFTNLNANNAFVDVGIVTDISGTRLTYTGVGTITTLDTDTATINNLSSDYINVGVATANILNSGIGTIVDLNNTRLVSGIATITDLNVTNSTFTNLNATNLNAVTGVVTDISGTRLNYTGVGTITTLDTDTADINNLTSNYINVGVATASIFNSGIGTITDLNNTRLVSGIATITTLNATNVVSTNSNFTNLNANNAYINVGVVTDISGTRLNYTGVGTIATLDTTNATIDDISNTNITVSGIATITSLNVLTNFDVYDTTATFHNNLFIAGNLSIGGTSSVIIAQDLQVLDKEITLGITTNAFNQDVSNDTTANHGGIAIASTEGYPLVDLSLAGFSSLPATYKQLMWVAANSYGVGTTDAWMFNYAVGIGSTQVPNDVRLAVGEVQITDHQINAITGDFDRLISGISTFTGADISNLHSNNLFAQSGIITDLSGTRLNYTGFGTIANLYSTDAYIDDIASNVGFATAFTAERLNVSGVGTIATLDSTTSTITNLNVTNSTFTNVNVNNLYAVSGIVTTLTSTHSTLENINSAGISTLNIVRTNTINSSGVVTAPTFVGDLLGVANYAHVSGYSTFSGYSDTTGFSTFSGYANAAGVSTFADYANNAGIATYAWAAGVSTYSGVAGYSTFSGYSDTTGFSTFSGYSNTSGFSTFSGYSNTSGFSTFSNYSDTSGFSTFSGYANATGVSTFADYANNAGIATYAWTAGVSTYSGVAGYSTFSGYSNSSGISTSVIGGIASVTQLNVSGIATINQLDVNQLSPDGSNYGIINFVPVADGVGTWSWQPVTSAGAGTLDGITVREEGSTVGTAGSITNLDFKGNNIVVTAIPLGAIATITTSDTPTFDSLDVTGVSTLGFATISSLYVAGVSTFSGITTFIGDVYIGGDLFVYDDIVFDEFTARNIIVTGISSLNIVTLNEITSAGVVTAPTFVGDLLGVANYAHISGFSTFSGYSNAAGVSTFADYANNAGIATYAWTAGVSTYSGVAGYSTFSGYSNTSGFSTFSGYSNAAGVSTFTDYANNAGIATYAWTAGVSTYSGVAGVSTNVIGGIASVTQLNVIGISTFGGNINASSATFSGNVTIGGTLTYEDVTNIDSIGVITARSDVRVDGNLSVIGITTLASGGGITTTGGDLFVGDDLNVAGDLNFNGTLYQNGVKFTSGIGIGSTSVNPQSGIISPTDRIGIGFTDINIVGTGISIAGYGSTVVIDFGNISGGGGSNVSISTIPPGISTSAGNLWWDSVNGDLKIYYVDIDGAQWIDANGGSQSIAIVSETSPTGYGITSSGTLWWDSTFGVLKVYYNDGDSTQWVDANAGSYVNYWTPTSTGIHTLGNVGLGTTNPTEKLQVNGNISIDDNVSYGTATAVTSSTAVVGIHSTLAVATYRSVEYTIQATEGTNFHTTKIIALHNGSNAYHSEYGTIFNNVGISTYDVDVSGGNIRLIATPSSSSVTNFKISFTAIKV